MAGRLPQELADDVVGSVLDCFRYGAGWGWRGEREMHFWQEVVAFLSDLLHLL